MMDGVDVSGFRKSYRVNGDGSTTMLKTRGGFPQFTTTKPEADPEREIYGVFQCLMVNPEREKFNGTEFAAAYRKIAGVWSDWYRKPIDGARPAEPNEWYFLESSEKEITAPKVIYYQKEKSKGAIDWFSQTGAYDETQPTVTWGMLPGGRNAEGTGYPREVPYTSLAGYTTNHPLFTDGISYGVFIDGKPVANNKSLEGKTILCAAIHNGKVRLLTGFSTKGYSTLGGSPHWEPRTQFYAYEQDSESTSPKGWRIVASIDKPWFMRHQFSFDPLGTKVVGIVSEYSDNEDGTGFPMVVELDFETLTPNFSNKTVRKTHVDGVPVGAGFSNSTVPGSSESYMNTYDQFETPEGEYETGYSEIVYPISVEYNSGGGIDVLKYETVRSYLSLGAPHDVFAPVKSRHLGWETLSIAAAFNANKATISAIDWGGPGLSESQIAAYARKPLAENPSGVNFSDIVRGPDSMGYSTAFTVCSDDMSIARASKGYEDTYINTGNDNREGSGCRHSNGQHRPLSGVRRHKAIQTFALRVGGAPSIVLGQRTVSVYNPEVGRSESVLLNALEVSWAGYGDVAPTPFEESEEPVSNGTLIQCDLRHNVYVVADDNGDPDFMFGSLAPGTSAPAWWPAPGFSAAEEVTDNNWRGDPSSPAAIPARTTGWMTVDQSGQHVVFQKHISWADPVNGNTWPKMIYATPGTQTEISPPVAGAVHVSPIFYANKKRTKWSEGK